LGTHVSNSFLDPLLTAELAATKLNGPDQSLPLAVRVRHGSNAQGKLLHYYLNYSGESRTITYPYAAAVDLLTGRAAARGAALTLGPWDPAILAEMRRFCLIGQRRRVSRIRARRGTDSLLPMPMPTSMGPSAPDPTDSDGCTNGRRQ
jgi:hypothetical protein